MAAVPWPEVSPLGVLVFAAGSVPVLALSWRSLRRPGYHGFPRFFAFEAILALVVLNAGVWFDAPWSPRQIASWVLLVGSVPLALSGFLVLRRAGRPVQPPPDAAEYGWEHTGELVTTGPYRFIRHPMYASLLLLAWGAALKRPGPAAIALAAVATLSLALTARADESECLARFGEAYRAYAERTRMFVPFVF